MKINSSLRLIGREWIQVYDQETTGLAKFPRPFATVIRHTTWFNHGGRCIFEVFKGEIVYFDIKSPIIYNSRNNQPLQNLRG